MAEQANTSQYYCQQCGSVRDAQGYCTATNDAECRYRFIAMPVSQIDDEIEGLI